LYPELFQEIISFAYKFKINMKENTVRIKAMLAAGMMIFIFSCAHAQTVNYSFSKSAAAYTPLTSAVTLASGSKWNARGYTIPIGFSFKFMGKNFDTLTIAPNGFILFGCDNERALVTFKGIIPVLDSANTYSTISYSSINNVLKIEYKNVGFGLSKHDNFNFQVWLNQQDNKVEFHTGSTTLLPSMDTLVKDSLIMPIVGLINPSMSRGNNGLLLSGNPAQPSAEAITGELKYIFRVPDPSTVYIFSPQ
jgi:hypothetical protein